MMIGPSLTSVHPSDLAAISERELGYARQTVLFCIVIGPQGQLVAVEDLVSCSPVAKTGMRMMLPKAQRRDDGLLVNFLWGRQRSPRETGSVRTRGVWRETGHRHFDAFRALHREILDGVTDTPLVAFLKLMDGWTPDVSPLRPGWEARGGSNFVFRFQYDDEFLHERHAARLAWDRACRRSQRQALTAERKVEP